MRDLVDQMGDTGRAPQHVSADDDRVERVKLHDFTVARIYDTGKAILITDNGEELNAKWLPKSQVEVRDLDRKTDVIKKNGVRQRVDLVEITIPEWLAKQQGLI